MLTHTIASGHFNAAGIAAACASGAMVDAVVAASIGVAFEADVEVDELDDPLQPEVNSNARAMHALKRANGMINIVTSASDVNNPVTCVFRRQARMSCFVPRPGVRIAHHKGVESAKQKVGVRSDLTLAAPMEPPFFSLLPERA
jgi:hypothetical protein